MCVCVCLGCLRVQLVCCSKTKPSWLGPKPESLSNTSSQRELGDKLPVESLQIEDATEGKTNESGLSPRVLVDLQRFLALGKLPEPSADKADGDSPMDVAQLNDFKTTVTLATSTRVNLLFRQPSQIRMRAGSGEGVGPAVGPNIRPLMYLS